MAVASSNEFPKVIFVEGAAPGTPPTGFVYAYAKADGLMYSKDDAGVETLMSGGAAAGGTVDIEDEGSAEGAADTIDFTGAGVSVTFAAGTATVNIPGGGGSTIVYGAIKPGTPDMDFTGSDLASATAHSSGGSFSKTHCWEGALDGSSLAIGFRASMGRLYWSASNVDQEWTAGGIKLDGETSYLGAVMPGIALLDSSGNGVGVVIYNDNNVYLAQIDAYQYAAQQGIMAGLGHNLNPNGDWALRLTRSGNTWDAYASLDGGAWTTHSSATYSRTITVDRKAIGLFYNTGATYRGRMLVDWADTP